MLHLLQLRFGTGQRALQGFFSVVEALLNFLEIRDLRRIDLVQRRGDGLYLDAAVADTFALRAIEARLPLLAVVRVDVAHPGVLRHFLVLLSHVNQHIESREIRVSLDQRLHLLRDESTHIVRGFDELVLQAFLVLTVCYRPFAPQFGHFAGPA